MMVVLQKMAGILTGIPATLTCYSKQVAGICLDSFRLSDGNESSISLSEMDHSCLTVNQYPIIIPIIPAD